MSESLSTFLTFPSLPRLAAASTSGSELPRQPATLPAAFPGKRGGAGDTHREARIQQKRLSVPSPFYLALPRILPAQEGRKPPAPHGAARGRNIWAAAAHPLDEAAGGSRCPEASLEQLEEPGPAWRGRGKAEEEAAR